MTARATHDLVGRDRLVDALTALVDRVTAGDRVVALVAGEAGIGKSSLLRAAVAHAAERGATTAWGTCLDVDGAPGYWPWTQALEGCVRALDPSALGDLGDDAALVATIVPSLGSPSTGDQSARDRLLAMDATRRLLERLARDRPLLLVLDDLQWADASSLELLDLVTRSPDRVGLGVIGAYRDNELSSATRHRLSSLVSGTEHLTVEGLDPGAVQALVERVTGQPVDGSTAAAVHRRTGGHPFFVRELALLGNVTEGDGERVPTAVRDAVARRVDRLPAPTVAALEAASLVGTTVLPDVVGAALGCSSVEIEDSLRPALDAGILTRAAGETRFAHDLLRETLHDRVEGDRRVRLHAAVRVALEDRAGRGDRVVASELARHALAALPLDGPEPAVRWALAAAADDRAALAFAEAAGRLRRLRGGLATAAAEVDEGRMVEVLVTEADALARAGVSIDARGLLAHAADLAARTSRPESVAHVALAVAQLGSRFATRRDDTVRQLERAREVVAGVDDALHARVTATLARELQHSVAEDRVRAAELSEQALELGRRAGEPATLLDCLLARHDVLWQPGGGAARAEVAREIVAVAIAAGDEDRHAEGLLVLANALLDQGSPAFEAPLESCLAILDARGQPRHRYTAITRRACVALLRGRLDEAERLIEEARALGDRILEPDTDNVWMSQRLELVRARADRDELVAFASAAVAHWTGAPVHAHSVAAGFLARAGDLDGARRHVAAVVDLGSWRVDRSYLWSVLVRELAVAAVALDDRDLCRELLEELRPLAGSCAVNGACVAFAGSLAGTAALLAGAVGEPVEAALLAEQAAAAYQRLGATEWLHATPPTAPATSRSRAAMRRAGPVWHVCFGGREATVAHTKGLADIARLLATPGTEVRVLDLVDAPLQAAAGGDVADRQALAAYRQRLLDLEAEIDDASLAHDEGRRGRAEDERQALLDELGRVTGAKGRPRQFANHPAERARKAVTARVRDAIRKLEPVLPELAAHLERTVVTGSYCRYRPDGTDWVVES